MKYDFVVPPCTDCIFWNDTAYNTGDTLPPMTCIQFRMLMDRTWPKPEFMKPNCTLDPCSYEGQMVACIKELAAAGGDGGGRTDEELIALINECVKTGFEDLAADKTDSGGEGDGGSGNGEGGEALVCCGFLPRLIDQVRDQGKGDPQPGDPIVFTSLYDGSTVELAFSPASSESTFSVTKIDDGKLGTIFLANEPYPFNADFTYTTTSVVEHKTGSGCSNLGKNRLIAEILGVDADVASVTMDGKTSPPDAQIYTDINAVGDSITGNITVNGVGDGKEHARFCLAVFYYPPVEIHSTDPAVKPDPADTSTWAKVLDKDGNEVPASEWSTITDVT